MNTKKLTIRDFSYIGIFVAIIAAGSQIYIPMPYGVPMTIQTFLIPLAGIVLGARNGTIATVIYIMLAAVGVPVLAEFSGGLHIVLGNTGGFILSFPLMSLAAGIGAARKHNVWLVLGLLAGMILNDICGMIYFAFYTSSNLQAAFVACVLPFIPTGMIKVILAAAIGKKIKTALVKSGVFHPREAQV